MKVIQLSITGLFLAGCILLFGDTLAAGSKSVEEDQKKLLQVKVHRLIIDPSNKQPVVILTDSLEENALLIWVGFFEANAIRTAMEGINHRRPLTHDLLERIIRKANFNIHRVVITHLKEGVFYASIFVESGGSLMEIDARPSDSIALALKFKALIFVAEKLFREMAVPLPEQKEIEERYGLKFQELTPSLAQAFSFGSMRGVLIADVLEGSPADKDGIERGDIFVAVGGRAIEDVVSIRNAFAKKETTVEVRIFRKRHFLSLTLHPN